MSVLPALPFPDVERLASIRAEAHALDRRLRAAEAAAVIRTALDAFAGRIAVVSSFGAESAVLLHLVATVGPNTPVLMVDTGKLFADTLGYRDWLTHELGLTDVRSIAPDVDELAAQDPTGDLHKLNPDACCALRKARPLARALAPFDAWISGRKRFQTASRAALPVTEIDGERVKINPLAAWAKPDLDAYFAAHGLPRHPLEAEGYLSIGCQPCTDRVRPGENPRAGRWRGLAKDECGIHGG
jgi:phosphoadenosine phosphosulfate reductase